ncbi:nuclease-related domain-containing protein [Niallia sp. 01092]|uniref:nuclease-related domain-containing protein n=1 Tax=unclassified Niallia TaxID=2837522 RepID=UPI003FD5BA10
MLIIHNLRLFDGKSFFQIDYLVLTPCFALILESKNYVSTLVFDASLNQFTRHINDQEEGYLDPISQAKRLQRQLHQFLQLNQLPTIPIENLIVISHPSTIIKGPSSIKNHVIHSHSLMEKWDNLSLKYKHEVLDGKHLREIYTFLLKANTPEEIDILKYYGLKPSDIITGVCCPSCMKFAMIRKKKQWHCTFCGTFNSDAHFQAVYDYFLLIKPAITNKEFREFVLLSSKDIAFRLLSQMHLLCSGNTKGRIYYAEKLYRPY